MRCYRFIMLPSQSKTIELKPIIESDSYWDALEARLKKLFKEKIYLPLLAELSLPQKTLKNFLNDPLVEALQSGRVTYNRGVFSGTFNAGISKALRALGARFDRRTSTYKISYSELPLELRNVISASEFRFLHTLYSIDEKLTKILPEKIADEFSCLDLFERNLYRVEKEFQKNVKNITVAPELTDHQRKRIAKEWQTNMEYWIKDFTQQEIPKLRKKVQETAFTGNRYGSLVQTIQDSYGVSLNKAKFLARQETHLLMAKFKEVRYTGAGVQEYKWYCVHQPHDKNPRRHTPGNVRYSHGLLEGKVFRWDDPPITSNPGEPVRRNNPGQDYNCRCFARPIVRVKKEDLK